MAVNNVIARISGIVTYSDGSIQQFSGHIDDQSNVSYNNTGEAQEAFAQADTDATWIDSMFALLGGTVLFTPTAAAVDKTVTDMVAEISGRTSYDDQTWGDFISQYVDGAFVPSGGAISFWTDAVAYSPTLTKLTTLLETVAGTGNVTIS